MDYKRYAKLRNEKGYSDADISRMLGINQTNISRIKLGRHRSLKPANMKKLADVLGCSVAYLNGESE